MQRDGMPTGGGRRGLSLTLAVLLASITVGCMRGPAALRASHEGQNDAIQARISEQLLLNVVRLKYRDNPLFLKVGNVVVQFEFSASAGAGITVNESGPEILSLPGGVAAKEQPTFTFTPLQDDEFVQRMLMPIDLDVIALLQRSGWSIERIFRLTVQRMNGIDNAASASGVTPSHAPRYEDFAHVARSMRALQVRGEIAVGYEPTRVDLSGDIPAGAISGSDLVAAAKEGYRFEASPDGASMRLTGPGRRLVMRLASAARGTQDAAAIVSALGLDPALPRYEIDMVTSDLPDTIGEAGRRGTIFLATRSLLGAIYYVSQAVEVPRDHVDDGLVTVAVSEDGRPFDWGLLGSGLMRIRTSAERPQGTAVAVRYRGNWFYIDDADLESKSTFVLLNQLFALQSGSQASPEPILTLPVGN